MRRFILLLTIVAFIAAMLTVSIGVTSAEGHFCAWWQYDMKYGGYWLYLDCPADEEDGRYVRWYDEIPSSYPNPQYLDPYYYE